MDYYKKQLYLAQVNQQDKLIGPIERWQAHEQGICHRGFTVILIYKNQVILQHRHHPAFDGLYDLSFSSHPIYLEDDRLQDNLSAIYASLGREWHIEKKDLIGSLKYLDKFYYKAQDPKSKYIEHEVDYLYLAEINKLPAVNKDFAYGFNLVEINKILNTKSWRLDTPLCPWVKKISLNKFVNFFVSIA